MAKVNVFRYADDEGYCDEIIARVEQNSRLDYWDGNNHTNGGTGMHKGATKLRKPVDEDKPYVIIVWSQWVGSKPYAYTATLKKMADEIMKADAEDDDWVWPEVREYIRSLEDNEV